MMLKWLPKRFKYVREMEEALREERRVSALQMMVMDSQKATIEDYQTASLKYNKLTLDEAHELFSCAVDYQRALKNLAAADPVEYRLRPLMEKYEIAVVKNPINESIPKAVKKTKEPQGKEWTEFGPWGA